MLHVRLSIIGHRQDFDECKELLIQRGEEFARSSMTYRNKIAQLGGGFIRDGAVCHHHVRIQFRAAAYIHSHAWTSLL